MKALKLLINNTFNKITTKVLIGYILLVLIPVILFSLYFYNQLYNELVNSYSVDKQNLINQSAKNMELSLTQVKTIYTLFQSNQAVIDYLSGRLKTDADQVYTYLKEIRPLFSYVYLGNESIESISLYKQNEGILPVTGVIEDIKDLDISFNIRKLNQLEPEQGYWSINENNNKGIIPSITYYQKLYNSKYTKELAILTLKFNNDYLNHFINTIKNSNGIDVIITQNDEIIYKDDELGLSNSQLQNVITNNSSKKSSKFWINKKNELLINHLHIDELNLNFYFTSSVSEIYINLRQKILMFGFYFLLLLFGLSAVYYLSAFVLTKRVLKLSNHMRKVDETNLSIYKEETSKDEIGFLIDSYNSLIKRINELINEVHHAELRQKDANYQVLQAQVNPHFLYNTLESIRMLAEIGNTSSVVESIYRLGKLLRYSISPNNNVATIEEELENIKDFLSIHKIRMSDRLSYSIEIDTKLEIKNITCPRLILQPLVENCIKHGLANIRRPGKINITISDWNSYLKIIISDNGQGIREEKLETIKDVFNYKQNRRVLETKNSGIGLYNVSERIKSYFGEKSRLEIKSKLNFGTSFILYIKI